MNDANEQRNQRERAARRWERLAVVVPVTLLVSALVAWWGARACGHDLFGWHGDYRLCSLIET